MTSTRKDHTQCSCGGLYKFRDSSSKTAHERTKMHVHGKRIRIQEDPVKKRYEVRCQMRCVKSEDRIKRFHWSPDKSAALTRAEEWRLALQSRYFGLSA